MAEETPFLDVRPYIQTDWNEHYNNPEGSEKVARRRMVGECLEEGIKPVDFDEKALDALEQTGLSETAMLVDVGCSYPKTLARWHKASIKLGKLYRSFIGIEPNTEQFNGLRFWQPLDQSNPNSHTNGHSITKHERFQSLRWAKLGKAMMGVELIQAQANELPIDDGAADVVAFMFSFYHIFRELQEPAVDEARRALKKSEANENDVEGIFVLATSGNENKDGMRKNETLIAAELARLMNTGVKPPEPLSSGFTSEDAVALLPKKFKYVYEYSHKAKIVIKNEKEKQIMLEAYRTLRDKYTDASGRMPDKEIFEIAMQAVAGKQFDDAATEGRFVEDKLRQSLFIASDRNLYLETLLPGEYQRITLAA